jgi:hypothetical protein
MENLTIGQAYKTATEVTFGATDAFVYDAEGEVFYALGHKYQGEVYYSIADLEAGGTEVITPSEPEVVVIPGEEAFEEAKGVNKPDLTYLPEGTTYAITYDGSNNPQTMALATAKTDTTWYDYSTKKWANIKTSNNGNDAYWVWIPRYAYKIDTPHVTTAQTINIKFLIGTSDIQADGSALPAGYTVHPAFTFGGKELTGIWVAKYEASSSNPTKIEGSYYTGGGNDTSLQVRVLPNVYSWRNLTNGSMQTVSLNMTSGSGSVGTTTGVDTHQMKNVEWGAVAYLAQSAYGVEPWINPYGDETAYKMKTGYAGEELGSTALAEGNSKLHAYNTAYGVNASTTGNVYGVYDMAGGAWERTAALLNNGNENISLYGKAEHVQNNKIRSEYEKYYDIYEPSDQEKEGGAYYGTAGTTLWNSGNAVSQNIIRKALTDGTYAKMANKKGDALWEISNGCSYYGMYTSGTSGWTWIISTTRDSSQGAEPSYGWNSDYMLIGHASFCWMYRGARFTMGSNAGLFVSSASYGYAHPLDSFRPVLVEGDSL